MHVSSDDQFENVEKARAAHGDQICETDRSRKKSVLQWGAESSVFGREWLPAAGWDWAWSARTVSRQMLMRGDIFAASHGGGAVC